MIVERLGIGDWRLLGDVDSKFRAHDLAQAARHARRRIRDLRNVIAFGVERSRHAQDMAWTVSFAHATAFAASGDEGDLPVRQNHLVVVKWNSPEIQVAPPGERYRPIYAAGVRQTQIGLN
jgi:hypothetical protein